MLLLPDQFANGETPWNRSEKVRVHSGSSCQYNLDIFWIESNRYLGIRSNRSQLLLKDLLSRTTLWP
jgi:hypothetical protein